MYPLHEERLQHMFAEVDAVPRRPNEDPREKMALKIKNLMPGSRFYEYLSANQSGPKLNGEAVDTYQRALFVNLRDHGDSMSIVDIAKSAYACAQKVQSENHGPKDDVAYQLVGADSKLTTWGCGGKVGLLGGSSCTHTKTEFEQLSFISSSIGVQ